MDLEVGELCEDLLHQHLLLLLELLPQFDPRFLLLSDQLVQRLLLLQRQLGHGKLKRFWMICLLIENMERGIVATQQIVV